MGSKEAFTAHEPSISAQESLTSLDLYLKFPSEQIVETEELEDVFKKCFLKRRR